MSHDMSPLELRLRDLRDRGQTGVIPYVTAGDPNLETTEAILLALAEAGAAAMEVGVPFSDPIADGPVIQAASQRALVNGATLDGILAMLERVSAQTDVPMILFSYLNPMARMGYTELATRATQVGLSGVLVTDALPGTEPDFDAALTDAGLDQILLVAPTTPTERGTWLAQKASGFLYVIARRGVTGKGHEEADALGHLKRLRAHTDVPLYVGFGVRTRADVERLSQQADGVIVGSALVDALHREPDHTKRPELAAAFLRELLGSST